VAAKERGERKVIQTEKSFFVILAFFCGKKSVGWFPIMVFY